ncbi:hypothetical protein V2J56_09320 [Georgenia sp. MJ206]|uniref:hypothetical protein n=1 Tax=Georgenia wangjunii TaxID=3117730 RepID=UPI002F26CED5
MDPELQAFRATVEEANRRASDAHAGVNTHSARYIVYEGSEPGQEWEQPREAAESYPAGWTVAHDGKTWTSRGAANTDEPGVRSWDEVATEDDPTEPRDDDEPVDLPPTRN